MSADTIEQVKIFHKNENSLAEVCLYKQVFDTMWDPSSNGSQSVCKLEWMIVIELEMKQRKTIHNIFEHKVSLKILKNGIINNNFVLVRL